jgi:hypothetical protein
VNPRLLRQAECLAREQGQYAKHFELMGGSTWGGAVPSPLQITWRDVQEDIGLFEFDVRLSSGESKTYQMAVLPTKWVFELVMVDVGARRTMGYDELPTEVRSFVVSLVNRTGVRMRSIAP